MAALWVVCVGFSLVTSGAKAEKQQFPAARCALSEVYISCTLTGHRAVMGAGASGCRPRALCCDYNFYELFTSRLLQSKQVMV